jgi:ribosomal protein S12
MAFERSKEIARSFKRELIVYQRVLRDERTPLSANIADKLSAAPGGRGAAFQRLIATAKQPSLQTRRRFNVRCAPV